MLSSVSPLRFPYHNVYEIQSLRATHRVHLILLDLMILTIFVTEYKLYSPSCNLPRPLRSKSGHDIM
jgi:hypothetical protein